MNDDVHLGSLIGKVLEKVALLSYKIEANQLTNDERLMKIEELIVNKATKSISMDMIDLTEREPAPWTEVKKKTTQTKEASDTGNSKLVHPEARRYDYYPQEQH